MKAAPIHELHFRAMGSHINLWLQHEDASEAAATLERAQGLFNVAERRMTRFEPESELSQLNQRAGHEWVPVSRLLWRVISRALQLAAETEGLFDPTVGGAVVASGYGQSFDAARRQGNRDGGKQGVPFLGQWRAVARDPARHAVRLPLGVQLDLGGIGKGFTAQLAADWLSAWGPCLVDAGGDVTAGDPPAGQPGWPVEISRPSQDDTAEAALTVWLNNATLATSGIDYRWWWQDGKRRHHLIDPRTGGPAETDLLTATVLAADASAAEAWATAMLISGSQRGLALATERQMAVALIGSAGKVHLAPAMERYVVHPAVVAVI